MIAPGLGHDAVGTGIAMDQRTTSGKFPGLALAFLRRGPSCRHADRTAWQQRWWIVVLIVCLVHSGCRVHRKNSESECVPCPDECLTPMLDGPSQLTPEDACIKDCGEEARELQAPSDFSDYSQVTYLDMTLEDCVAAALQNSKIMRDLGGSILRASGETISTFDPAIVYTDPRQGEEAALSAFDASFFASANYEKIDRASNNRFLGNLGLLQQDLQTYRTGVQKITAAGTRLRLQNVTARDFNNQQGNFFPPPSSTWDTSFDAEFRQPLLQGYGTNFNRIAGPDSGFFRIPGLESGNGLFNGVLIARTQTDMTLARFEQGVQEFLCNVENAYWDLYFAYRDLEAKIDARNEALITWRKIASQAGGAEGSRTGAEAQQIAQAEEQYFRFEAEVVDALNGRMIDGTRTNNGSTGGTFRANSGVRVTERRLRLIMGLPINGDQLIRPADVPIEASIKFDWDESVDASLQRRPELRQQRWNIKRVELEYIASKNFLLPRLDLTGRYRFRGFGEDLLGSDLSFSENPNESSAFGDLLSGDRQEWQVGAELSVPIGYRQEFAAVRNSELRLAKERALLREKERDIMLGLSNSVAELQRAYEAKMAALNRLKSAEKLRDALDAVIDLKNAAPLDVKLEAQRRVADAKIYYYTTQVEYMLAIKNVHLERSTLLDYYNVRLAESISDSGAYVDAERRDMLRGRPMNYVNRGIVVGTERASDALLMEGAVPGATPLEVPVAPQPTPSGEAAPAGDPVPENSLPDSSSNEPLNGSATSMPLPAVNYALEGPSAAGASFFSGNSSQAPSLFHPE